MTADERIEKLLNQFGQTISDLPKPTYKYYAYKAEPNLNAAFAARDWENSESFPSPSDLTDYICHLTDVIDRMEVALETAKFTMDCKLCKTPFKVCQLDCETHAKVTDWQLSGMDQDEFKEFVDGEGQKDA